MEVTVDKVGEAGEVNEADEVGSTIYSDAVRHKESRVQHEHCQHLKKSLKWWK